MKFFNNNLIKTVFLGLLAVTLFIPAQLVASIFLDLLYYFYSAVGLSFFGIDIFAPDGWLKHIGIGVLGVTPLYFFYTKFNLSVPIIYILPAVLFMVLVIAGNLLGNDPKLVFSSLSGLILIAYWAYIWTKEEQKS